MRKLILFTLLACSLPCWASWTVVQHKINGGCTAASSTCAITVTSTGSGNVIVLGMSIASNVEAIVSCSDGTSTYVHPAGRNGTDASSGQGTDVCYTLASTSGKTSITVTRTDATSHAWIVGATEFSFTSGPVSVDGSDGNRDQSTVSTSPAGVTMTLTGSNDAIYQLIRGVTPTVISSPYSTNSDFSGNAAFASAINLVSGTAPTWTQTSGRAALSAIAFTETAASGCNNFIALMGAGCK